MQKKTFSVGIKQKEINYIERKRGNFEVKVLSFTLIRILFTFVFYRTTLHALTKGAKFTCARAYESKVS